MSIKLKGSIVEQIKLKGSTISRINLRGNVEYIIKLRGMVDTFVKSVSGKLTIFTTVRLNINSYIERRIIGFNILPKTQLLISTMIERYAKLNILPIIQTQIKTSIYRNAKSTIETTPVLGKSAILSQIKAKTLGQIKGNTLKQITFGEGVIASIHRNMKTNIEYNTEVLISAKVVRKTKLSDIKSKTLGEIKTQTLRELTEYEI